MGLSADDIVYNADRDNFFGFGAGTEEDYTETKDGKEIVLEQPKKARYIYVINNGSSLYSEGGHFVEIQAWAKEEEQPEGLVWEDVPALSGSITYDDGWTMRSQEQIALSYKKGAKASLTFYGTGIRWIGQKDINFGTAIVTLDGETTEVNTNGSALWGITHFEKTGLTEGVHTISIEPKDEGVFDVSGCVDVEKFVVQYDTSKQIAPSAISLKASKEVIYTEENLQLTTTLAPYEETRVTGNTVYVAKHLVETLEDMKVFQYVCEHTTFQEKIREFIEEDKRIGDMGIASVDGGFSPVQQLLQYIAGVENTVYLTMDYPDEMEELMAVMHEKNKRLYQTIFQYPCDFVFAYEDTSTTVMSRTMFEDSSLPAINDYADLVHAQGKVFITHMCGKLTGFKDLIAKGRQDGIDSVCPPETGDLYPWDARKAWGAKRVIGGIDPPSLVLQNRESILKYVREIVEKVEDKRGFILSTGDAVPDDKRLFPADAGQHLPQKHRQDHPAGRAEVRGVLPVSAKIPLWGKAVVRDRLRGRRIAGILYPQAGHPGAGGERGGARAGKSETSRHGDRGYFSRGNGDLRAGDRRRQRI